ncbi:MAG TPA: RES family NAD+ phosphorylase [Pricia sp.]|nr:RES family NAD+ phosphorylase [Pricia sp.]
MRVYRLSKERYKTDLSGKGAEQFGGRWNSKGVRMLYTADSRALAKLEVAVNLALHKIPKNYFLTVVEIPDTSIVEYDVNLLKGKEWKHNPPIKFTQSEGDAFVGANRGLALKVPSAVVEGDFNYVINPGHPDAKLLSIESMARFEFDMRLFK